MASYGRRRRTGRFGVLIIDDDAAVRRVLTELLHGEGIPVAVAENGRDALELLRRTPLPELIVLDLWMPEMDGLTFRALQLREPLLAEIPVVVVTQANEGQRIAASMGVEACLPKPLDLDLLLSTVAQYVGRPRMDETLRE